jgi:hypothetical protein
MSKVQTPFLLVAACIALPASASFAEEPTLLTAGIPKEEKYGPFGVTKVKVETKIIANKGDTVHVVSHGLLNFGSGLPLFGIGDWIKNADGDANQNGAPEDYPAPHLVKNSLICGVKGKWYQGGTDTEFTPAESGEQVLFCNDGRPDDNSRGWQVTVYITRKK